MKQKHSLSSFQLHFLPILILLLHVYVPSVSPCELIGKVIGNCVKSSDILPFVDLCGPYLSEHVCVPLNDVKFFFFNTILTKIQNIWQNWTNGTVNDQIYDFTISQLVKEFSKELQASDMPLINNSKCLPSYIAFICKTNFKRCNPDSKIIKAYILAGKTDQLCISLCQDYADNCMSTNVVCNKDGPSLPNVRICLMYFRILVMWKDVMLEI